MTDIYTYIRTDGCMDRDNTYAPIIVMWGYNNKEDGQAKNNTALLIMHLSRGLMSVKLITIKDLTTIK